MYYKILRKKGDKLVCIIPFLSETPTIFPSIETFINLRGASSKNTSMEVLAKLRDEKTNSDKKRKTWKREIIIQILKFNIEN